MGSEAEPSGNLESIRGDIAIRLHNETCPYCGNNVKQVASDEDHVIGRRFVPKGKLFQSWNLILRACVEHNNQKSNLEDDLSAITMHAHLMDRRSESDAIQPEALRKARGSVSRRTGRSVSGSIESMSLVGELGPGFSIRFNLWAPPQADRERVFQLACMQLQAVFYWLTYDERSQTGRFWGGTFFQVDETTRLDWGNSLQVGFANAVSDWPTILHLFVADGYFRVSIRRHPRAFCWAWALEWNKSHRIIGFFGDADVARTVAGGLKRLQLETVAGEGANRIDVRKEVPLTGDADLLFAVRSSHQRPEEQEP